MDAHCNSARQHDVTIPLRDHLAIVGDDMRLLADERAWAYQCGYSDGFEAGRRAAEVDLDRHWVVVSRNVRANARRPTYSERRRRELERARPKPSDFTGALSEAEYFGADGCAA